MTAWEKLPELLTRSQVMEITGWSFRAYRETLKLNPKLAICTGKRWKRVRTRELKRLLQA